jgi:hypothetical protein
LRLLDGLRRIDEIIKIVRSLRARLTPPRSGARFKLDAE